MPFCWLESLAFWVSSKTGSHSQLPGPPLGQGHVTELEPQKDVCRTQPGVIIYFLALCSTWHRSQPHWCLLCISVKVLFPMIRLQGLGGRSTSWLIPHSAMLHTLELSIRVKGSPLAVQFINYLWLSSTMAFAHQRCVPSLGVRQGDELSHVQYKMWLNGDVPPEYSFDPLPHASLCCCP